MPGRGRMSNRKRSELRSCVDRHRPPSAREDCGSTTHGVIRMSVISIVIVVICLLTGSGADEVAWSPVFA
jgi:hypothetical protein